MSSDYYAVLVNVDEGLNMTVGPYSYHTAAKVAANTERRPDCVAGVIGRRDGGPSA